MRSERMKKGIEKAPHRSLFHAIGYLKDEIERPIIGIANSANELIPGHIHLNRIAQAVKDAIRMAGGTPMEFSTIGICDGIAMNHEGMKYSLGSRELICDSVEVMCKAYPFDGLVFSHKSPCNHRATPYKYGSYIETHGRHHHPRKNLVAVGY